MVITGCQYHKHNNMKAKEINGGIKIFRKLPETWEDENGLHLNFRQADASSFGFYDVVKPSHDKDTQTLGAIYFDSKKKVFTYPVSDIDFDAVRDVYTEVVGEDGESTFEVSGTEPVYNLDSLKSSLISQIKTKAGELLKPTDWYVIRLAERAIEIPDSIVLERAEIIAKSEAFEIEVQSLTTYKEALKYKFSYTAIEEPII